MRRSHPRRCVRAGRGRAVHQALQRVDRQGMAARPPHPMRLDPRCRPHLPVGQRRPHARRDGDRAGDPPSRTQLRCRSTTGARSPRRSQAGSHGRPEDIAGFSVSSLRRLVASRIGNGAGATGAVEQGDWQGTPADRPMSAPRSRDATLHPAPSPPRCCPQPEQYDYPCVTFSCIGGDGLPFSVGNRGPGPFRRAS